MRSIMPPQHSFATVPRVDIPRSVFNRTHGLKTTFDAGKLIPIFWDWSLPGDSHQVNLSAFARLSTPIVPTMDNLRMKFFFFNVPLRLLQTNFVKLMGEQTDPGDSIAFLCPTVDVQGEGEMTLADYFGCNINEGAATVVNSYKFRAYNLIWNEWFRDENLQDSEVVDLDDGPDAIADYQLLNCGKKHDYFTSCLPFPQKGDAVSLPLGTKAPLIGIGKGTQTFDEVNLTSYETEVVGAQTYAKGTIADQGDVDDYICVEEDPDNAGYPGMFADLTNATASTINELRQAFQIQKLLEKDARGGTRYIELIKSQFGVDSPDLRATRPEYLGGGEIAIHMNPVARTNDFGAAQGADLSAFATGAGEGIGFNASFTEHGVIIGLVTVSADLTYQQGMERDDFKSTKYDFYWPSLAHIGEQAVLNREIYFDSGAAAQNLEVFGYIPRYDEYRFKLSKITGLFRSAAAGTLEIYHYAEDFAALPLLDDTFIQSDPPIDRTIATPAEPHFIYDSYIRVKSIRPMPVSGVPGLIDHF